MAKVHNIKQDDGVKIQVMTVTPDMARSWLGNMNTNRKVRSRTVAELVRIIKAGKWHLNGDTIRFDTSGHMMDGQHRSLAIISAGQSVQTLVITGIEPEAGLTIDNGIRRSTGDKFVMDGVKDGNAVAGAVKFMAQIANRNAGITPTAQEAFDIYAANPGISDSIRMCYSVPSGLGMRANLATVHYIGGKMGFDVDAFVSVMKTGISRRAGDPAQTLREWVFRNKMGNRSIAPTVVKKALCQALDYEIAGRSITSMRVRDGLYIKGFGAADLL